MRSRSTHSRHHLASLQPLKPVTTTVCEKNTQWKLESDWRKEPLTFLHLVYKKISLLIMLRSRGSSILQRCFQEMTYVKLKQEIPGMHITQERMNVVSFSENESHKLHNHNLNPCGSLWNCSKWIGLMKFWDMLFVTSPLGTTSSKNPF